MEQNSSLSPDTDNSTTPRLPYMPGLDGLRAISVIAVMLFHAGISLWGGFLGVESFFALSGFLITALLLAEWRHTGRIDLRNFWMRRAQRLLPALLVLLAGTAMIGAFLPRGEANGLAGDILAALAYVFNWSLIAGGNSYFDPFLRPPLLQHLWSLAVEEQFYLIWPLLVLIGARLFGLRGLLLATLGLAASSVALMAHLFVPGADPSRIYYGTDTRASGLLLGAAMALVWAPGSLPGAASRPFGYLIDVIGLIGFGGLLYGFARLHEQNPFLYRGGFPLIALATLAVVAAVSHPQARLMAGVLGWAPLRWIGVRSYALYLWHWPIFQITRPYVDVPFEGWQLLAVRLAIVVVLADLSYRLVEQPIRSGGLGRLRRAIAMRRASKAGKLMPSGDSRFLANSERVRSSR